MGTPETDSNRLDVVIAGAGVGGIEALIALHDLAGERVAITLLAPDHDFVFRPLSVGDPFALGAAQTIPVARIAADFGAELRRDGLHSVDAERHVVQTTDGASISYDRLIVAVGAPRVPAYQQVTTFRGLEDVEALHGLVRDVEDGYSHRIAFVVPAGIAWSLPLYELALMTARRAFEMNAEVELTLITPEESPLAVFGAGASAELGSLLEEAGIAVHAGASAEIAGKGTIVLHPGREAIEADRIVALPVIHGPRIAGLPGDSDGFIPIDDFVRVSGQRDIFAVGDGTTFPIKQGGIACQQADVAATQIARDAGVELPDEPFRAVLRGKLMTGGAAQYMRHDVSGLTGEADESGTDVLWWPPTKVAGRYLAPYLETAGA